MFSRTVGKKSITSEFELGGYFIVSGACFYTPGLIRFNINLIYLDACSFLQGFKKRFAIYTARHNICWQQGRETEINIMILNKLEVLSSAQCVSFKYIDRVTDEERNFSWYLRL